jgi:hypothetical protein
VPSTVASNEKMYMPIKILLQTTVADVIDDWRIERFRLLTKHLRSLRSETGDSLFEVVARNRTSDESGDDPILSSLDHSDFDELWLFAVDTGDGLSQRECAAITRFRQRGGGILATRDHQDLGSSVCSIGGIGKAHFFHSRNLDPDASRHSIDDQETPRISWPNYHSGSNGDYQTITALEPLHDILRDPLSPSGFIEFLPAHPHEGGVGVPEGERNARVIAIGISKATHRPFNLIVAFEESMDEHGNHLGRGIAESSFHHFADYNWDTNEGCPSFVEEEPGRGMIDFPRALEQTKVYVRNAALWLAAGRNR